jgi:hypothetical protein
LLKTRKICDKLIFPREKPIFPAEKSIFLARNSYRRGDEKREEDRIEDEMREDTVMPLRGISGAGAPHLNS